MKLKLPFYHKKSQSVHPFLSKQNIATVLSTSFQNCIELLSTLKTLNPFDTWEFNNLEIWCFCGCFYLGVGEGISADSGWTIC
jgi:ABC-type amino acid transport system permease subunit